VGWRRWGWGGDEVAASGHKGTWQERKSFSLLSACLADFVWRLTESSAIALRENETPSTCVSDKFVIEKSV
jgi:hypothetical protein